MIWPFKQRAEVRESSYTDALVASIVAATSGKTVAEPTATGALEASAGLVARCFAGAQVKGPAFAVAALSPLCLSTIGRALIRRGEIVIAIEVSPDGELSLSPAADWDVSGDYEPSSWQYRLNLSGPSRYTTRANVPSAAVVHVRYQVDPDRPWRGVGPLQAAALTGRLSAETVSALGDEASGPRGNLLPLPVDGEDPTVAKLKADLRTLGGKLAFVESVKTMHPGAASSSPSGDWETKRIGADPPESLVTAAGRASVEVYAACGIPPSLFVERAEGTAQRESFRRVLHSTVQPIAAIAERELSDKLDADVTLNFDRLFAADLSGRARAFQSMVGGGMDVSKAAALAGLMAADGD